MIKLPGVSYIKVGTLGSEANFVLNKILLEYNHIHLSTGCLQLPHYNSVTEWLRQRLYSSPAKMFTIWPFAEKVCPPQK